MKYYVINASSMTDDEAVAYVHDNTPQYETPYEILPVDQPVENLVTALNLQVSMAKQEIIAKKQFANGEAIKSTVEALYDAVICTYGAGNSYTIAVDDCLPFRTANEFCNCKVCFVG